MTFDRLFAQTFSGKTHNVTKRELIRPILIDLYYSQAHSIYKQHLLMIAFCSLKHKFAPKISCLVYEVHCEYYVFGKDQDFTVYFFM